MNKQELLRAVAEKSGMTIKDTGVFYEAFVETVKAEMKKGEKIALVGFGTFSAKKREAREGINPLTKETIKIPAKVVASFKAGSKLKDALN